jgi:hypothetical protein
MCLHSLAVAADVQFACPPAISLFNGQAQDDQSDEPLNNGMLYAAVNKGSSEMDLCAWALDKDLLSLKKPTATIKVRFIRYFQMTSKNTHDKYMTDE